MDFAAIWDHTRVAVSDSNVEDFTMESKQHEEFPVKILLPQEGGYRCKEPPGTLGRKALPSRLVAQASRCVC